ncbi:response regulator [Aliikangiella marina]|uniref:Response regulator n=1 Tax=Aliikangiella marina TaxID=1712262 RepID=A0A545TCQ1_9GAMM|nr:response regulator [Aliikangiella marina]TQV74971.1 response regulator [Aliikangiella marina]
MSGKKILIVEDEIKIAELLSDYLKQSSFDTHMIHRGDAVEHWLENNRCDLILLDLMLPGKDGIEICKTVRQSSNLPIIMVTAKVEEIDRLIGLEVGADDYICKPFSPREVVARVKAVMRRFTSPITEDVEQLTLDKSTFKVKFQSHETELTKVEFSLIEAMYRRKGQIFSRAQLMNAIYEDRHIVSDRTIDSHIKKIRRKLSDIGVNDNAIQSVYGAGYKFDYQD